jgi:predicted dehydrogenase
MDNPVRIGIIGLGPRWRKRYQPALRALGKHFQVRALCDEIYQRAVAQAKRQQCAAVMSPTELLEREDVDALLLPDRQWFQLWPVEIACRLRKPVLCGSSLTLGDARIDTLPQQIKDSQVPVVVGMSPRFAPVTARLRELFAGPLGPPRFVVCDWDQPQCPPRAFDPIREESQVALARLSGDGSVALLDWCAGLMGDAPLNVLATGVEGWGFVNLLFEFSSGRAVQITRRRSPGLGDGLEIRPTLQSSLRVQVVTERGRATVKLPAQVAWTSGDGKHVHVLRSGPLYQVMLEHFGEIVRGKALPEPNVNDALRVIHWLRAAALSLREGRRVNLIGEQTSFPT